MPNNHLRRFLGPAVLLVLFLAGCTASVSTADLEEQVSSELHEEVGEEPADVSCPDELEATEGETAQCTLEAEDGTEFGVTVQTTNVDGNEVEFSVQVDEEPK